MLLELAVRNLALIDDARVELSAGFCAWTGETGAGKTLLLSALGLLLGERGSTELIRAGAEELRIVGCFDVSRPELKRQIEQQLDERLEEDRIILMRRLNHSGRSSAYVNDAPASIATLRALGHLLVAIHGQRESLSLLDTAYQLRLLDAFGDIVPLREKYSTAAENIRALQRRRRELLAERQQRQREISLLQFERVELDGAELSAGEKEKLVLESQQLKHALSISNFAAQGCLRLYDDEASVFDQIAGLHREAGKWSKVDPAVEQIEKRLTGLSTDVQDLAEALRDLSQSQQADPARQERIEERLAQLEKLEHKYQKNIEELIAYRATLNDRQTELQQQEDDLAELDANIQTAWSELRDLGRTLSARRQKIAKQLGAQAQKHLGDLGMKEAKLEAVLEPIELGDDACESEIPSHGLDQLELMLTANKGEPALPLRKVASGGEMSRTMLALKTVLAAQDHVGTLVFDEIDANVGGRLGDVLGQKLASLGQTHQIICVTHLPQVASYARHQWTIRKTRRGKRNVTSIEPLGEKERLDELATMLRGESKGETTHREAAAMLDAARPKW